MTKKAEAGTGNTLLIVIIIILVAVVLFMGVKFIWAKHQWSGYAVKTQSNLMMNYPNLDAREDAMMIAMTVATVPSAYPLYKQHEELQNYVGMISKQTGRDLVVVDSDEMILADTVPENIGKKYMEDKEAELKKTITDGQVRYFTEQSNDYPQGISETVVVMKDNNGKTLGAVIFSSSKIFK